MKITTDSWGTVEQCEVAWNNGSRIWFDYADSGSPIIIQRNYIHDNGPKDSGIFFEASENGLIINNVLVNNERRGIYLAASNHTRVYNNTIIGTRGFAAAEIGGMPRGGKTLLNNEFINNIICGTKAVRDFIVYVERPGEIENNRSDFNCFWRPGGTYNFIFQAYTIAGARAKYSAKRYGDLASWSKITGFDNHSLIVDPLFLTPSPGKYPLARKSPLVDAGLFLPIVGTDYVGEPRPQGHGYDIGAFEVHTRPGPAPAKNDQRRQ